MNRETLTDEEIENRISDIPWRLRELRGKTSPLEFTLTTGISSSRWHELEAGKRKLEVSDLAKISLGTLTSPGWILFGRGTIKWKRTRWRRVTDRKPNVVELKPGIEIPEGVG